MRKLETNFTKQKCRKLVDELQDKLDSLFAFRDHLEQLKGHTVKRIENLSQIELSLFERELSIESKQIVPNQRGPGVSEGGIHYQPPSSSG